MTVKAINTPIKIHTLNSSVQVIYQAISENSIKVKDIENRTEYSPRTVRLALQILLDLKLIIKVPDLADLRSHYYQLNCN